MKQPYYGFYGFLTGKIKWGETVTEAAARELEEETGLKANPELIYIRHKMDYEVSGNLLEDKFFFGHRAVNCSGNLKENFDGGKNSWLTEKEILGLPNRFDGVEESLKMTENRKLVFVEKKYNVKGY